MNLRTDFATDELPGSLPDLETARQQEAERRLRILGDLAGKPYDYHAFKQRSKETRVPIPVLKAWHDALQSQGEAALKPAEWEPLDVQHHAIVLERIQQLGNYIHAVTVSKEDFLRLAEQNDWKLPGGAWNEQRARRLLDRYQVGGVWGLAPDNDPKREQRIHSTKKQKQEPPRDYATLDEQTLATIEQRREMLGPLTDQQTVSVEEVRARAQEVGVAERTLWGWLSDYRAYGRIGLAPRQRSDIGKVHGLSERIEQLITAVRLSYRDATPRKVLKEVTRRAQLLGEKAPTIAQVRNVIAGIPEPVIKIADGREKEFRNKYRFTFHIRFDKIVYQLDHTRADMLLRDIRRSLARTESEETRGFLTGCLESNSRRVLSYRFGYDQPNSFNVVGVIRDAILVGGIPDEIWVDFGSDLISDEVRQFLQALGIELVLTNRAELKGRIERIFGTFNTQYWAEQEGYTHSNVVARNEKAVARYVIAEAERNFGTYLDTDYHQSVHSSLGMTPLEYWAENCFAEPCDPRLLDELLKKPEVRTVGKMGIKYEGRQYWHRDLGVLVGEEVLVRADPSYYGADTIEVYFNGYWWCQAVADDSEAGMRISGDDVRAGQKAQRRHIRKHIDPMRRMLRETDKEIAQQQAQNKSQQPPAQSTNTDTGVVPYCE
jgi:putative transposase